MRGRSSLKEWGRNDPLCNGLWRWQGGRGDGGGGRGHVMQEVVGANGWGEEIATQETENG